MTETLERAESEHTGPSDPVVAEGAAPGGRTHTISLLLVLSLDSGRSGRAIPRRGDGVAQSEDRGRAAHP